MATTAELNAIAKLHDAHVVAIFLAEEGDGTQFLGVFNGHVAMVLQRNVFADAAVDDAFHLTDFLWCHLLEV